MGIELENSFQPLSECGKLTIAVTQGEIGISFVDVYPLGEKAWLIQAGIKEKHAFCEMWKELGGIGFRFCRDENDLQEYPTSDFIRIFGFPKTVFVEYDISKTTFTAIVWNPEVLIEHNRVASWQPE